MSCEELLIYSYEEYIHTHEDVKID